MGHTLKNHEELSTIAEAITHEAHKSLTYE
jgi:hypothetical protein